MTTQSPQKRAVGLLGYLCLLIGGGCLLFALLGALNTLFDWRLVLSFRGAHVPVPNSWDVVIGLLAVGVIIIGLTLFGRYVAGRFRAAKGRPLVRVGILVGAAGLLVLAFRGLQILALTSTYGSMLAYYATDGDLDDVKAELAKGATHEDLDRAVSRAAQYSNGPALGLLMEAGADLLQSTREYKRCPLAGTTPEFIEVAVNHGAHPETCHDSASLIWMEVNDATDDARMAKVVALLAKGGWSAAVIPEHGKGKTALSRAREKKLPQTAAALEALGS